MNTYIFNLSPSQLEESYVDTDDLDVDVTDMLKKRGRIFSCTPIQNITFRRSDLRRFNELLANDLLKYESNQSIKYIAAFNMVETKNQPFLKITVGKCQNNQTLGMIYEGLFFTWNSSNSGDETNVNLPLAFCVANQKYINLINTVIEKHFSCTISAIMFAQLEIKWLIVLALHHIVHTPHDIKLVYEIPRLESKFTVSFSFDVLKDIWDRYRVNTEDSGRLNFDDVARLHASIEEHVSNTLGFDLSHFQLKTVFIPGYLTLDVSGKIQILKIELIDLFYRFMNDRILSK